MKTLEQAIDKVTDIMVSDFYAGCDDYRPIGLHLIAFIYSVDINSLRDDVDNIFHTKLRTRPDPIGR